MEEPFFLEDMEKIQRAMCNIKGNFVHLIFDRNNVIDLSEWLHEAYFNNNEDIHQIKIQDEQLLERLQDTCSSSYVSDCHVVDCLEDSHAMMDHEKHEKLQVLDVFEDDIYESQSITSCAGRGTRVAS